MQHELIVAIDPGGTTGVAACLHVRDAQELVNWVAYELTPQQTLDWLWAGLEAWGAAAQVVCERFTIGPQTLKMSRQHDAIEIIGAARWMTQRHGAGFKLQDPATAKRMCSNDALRSNGLWHRGGHGHANDASRHLVVALVERGWYGTLVG